VGYRLEECGEKRKVVGRRDREVQNYPLTDDYG
jgi:hypothetical protein